MVFPRSLRALSALFTLAAAAAVAGAPMQGALAAPAHVVTSAPAGQKGSESSAAFSWHVTPTGSSEEFRGLAAVSHRIAWVSGEAGSVLRTTDGGGDWQDVSPPAAKGLALRDIEAWSARRAVALSIGPGDQSRIFTTSDGGAVWKERFRNPIKSAFFDCMAFSAGGRGIALSDPVNGHFRLAVSSNFGRSWHLRSTAGMPSAEDGEFAFAASGTCIVAIKHASFAFVTGGVDAPRVFRTSDFGRTWTATETPLRGGPAAGIYSVAFRNLRSAVIVGGDYTAPANGHAASGFLDHSRNDWKLSSTFVHGYRSGAAFLRGADDTVLAVGPTGSDVSRDGGRTWTKFDGRSFDAVECAGKHACWASGTDGRVATLASH
jgi:photosystem II stability/assembly factor-like uncharacterized protein